MQLVKLQEAHDYLTNVLGVPEHESKTQAKLFIPSDLGDIKKNTATVISFLSRLSSKVKGRMLVLFTSLSTVKQVYL